MLSVRTVQNVVHTYYTFSFFSRERTLDECVSTSRLVAPLDGFGDTLLLTFREVTGLDGKMVDLFGKSSKN